MATSLSCDPSLSAMIEQQNPTIVAVINLADETERSVCDLIRRMHSGRWPRLRMFAIRRVGSTLVELAQWRRSGKVTVITWDLTMIGMSWRENLTPSAARRVFADATGQSSRRSDSRAKKPLVRCASA